MASAEKGVLFCWLSCLCIARFYRKSEIMINESNENCTALCEVIRMVGKLSKELEISSPVEYELKAWKT